MFLRQRLSAIPRLYKLIDLRIKYILASNSGSAKSLSAFSVDELTPLKVSPPVLCSSYRRISRSAPHGSSPASVKDAPTRQRKKWTRKANSPLITAASVIDSVFEKKATPTDALPGKDASGQAKNAKSPGTVIRRREFLSDSAEYRSSSLEMLKELGQRYNKEDEDRARRWVAEDSPQAVSALPSAEVTAILGSLSRAPWHAISQLHSSTLRELSNLACQNSSMCTDEEFVNIMLGLFKINKHVSLTPEHRLVLERECEKRLCSWDVNTLLLVSDWCICLERKSPFNRSILGALSGKLEEMTPQNVIQAFYVIGECQYVPSEGFLQGLTDRVEQHLDSFTWNEIGVVCNAFIKSQSRILSRPLQEAVSARICQDLRANSLDHYNLVTAMRFISRAYFHNFRLFEAMADSLIPHIPEMPFLVPPHIATSFAKVRHFNKPLMDAIASRALQTADRVRLKDIWMLLWAFCRLNYDPPNSEDFFSGLVHQLADKFEEVEQPIQLMKSLVSLTFIGQYPFTLIDRVFSPKTLEEYEEKCPKDMYKHLYTLDCSIAIEQPDYRGNRLPQEFIDKFWESPHGSKKVPYEKIPGLLEALQGLQFILGGTEYVKAHAILPHIRTPVDIEVHLDGSSKPIPLNSTPSSSLEELIGMRTNESTQSSITRLAVLVAPKAHYRFYSRDLLGVHVMKRRQLQKVGYKIVEVPYYEWLPLLNAPEVKRHDYLQAKIFA